MFENVFFAYSYLVLVKFVDSFCGMYSDVDECERNTDNCHEFAHCDNTVGNFICTCYAGYSGDGVTCSDINECATGADNCDEYALCINTVGSFICTCKDGFTGNGISCFEVDECESGEHDCHVAAICTNTVGSFNCTCLDGFVGDGGNCTGMIFAHFTIRNSSPEEFYTLFYLNFKYTLVNVADVDECEFPDSNRCDAKATCFNTAGDHRCVCPSKTMDVLGDGRYCQGLLSHITLRTVRSKSVCFIAIQVYCYFVRKIFEDVFVTKNQNLYFQVYCLKRYVCIFRFTLPALVYSSK